MLWKQEAEANKDTISRLEMADDEDLRNERSFESRKRVQDNAPDRPSQGLVAAKLGESRTMIVGEHAGYRSRGPSRSCR